MQIEAGIFDLVLVAGYEKGSETVIDRLDRMALDPFFEQPVVQRADLLAGLELTRLLHETGIDRRAIAHVAAKNRRAGRPSPFGRNLTADDVLASPVLASPVTTAEWAAFADGAVAVLLASEAKARELAARRGDQRAPVTLDGWGFAAETAWVNDKNYAALPALSVAAQKAYATAGVTDPASAFAFAELDDRYAHREVMGALALGLTTASRASAEILGGRFDADGALPINPSGGRLGGGDLFTGAGLRAVVEAAWALRRTGGEAVKREWSAGWQTCLAKPRTGASRALVATLFGPAGTNGAVAVLGGAAAKK
jgi:acetyl-CoA C-acetyltransferase